MEPLRIEAVEKQLEGQPIAPSGDANAALDTQQIISAVQTGMANYAPQDDFRASGGYRSVSGMNLAFRALEEAATISRWRNMLLSKGGH